MQLLNSTPYFTKQDYHMPPGYTFYIQLKKDIASTKSLPTSCSKLSRKRLDQTWEIPGGRHRGVTNLLSAARFERPCGITVPCGYCLLNQNSTQSKQSKWCQLSGMTKCKLSSFEKVLGWFSIECTKQ